MALTIGTPTSSGNKAASSGFSFNNTPDANTKALVVVVTGVDSSATDSVVSGITFGGVALESARARYKPNGAFFHIWYLKNPTIALGSVAVTMGGACTDVQATAIPLVSSTADTIAYDTGLENGDADTTHGFTISSVVTGAMGIAAIWNDDALTTDVAPTSTPTSGTLVTGSEADNGVSCNEVAWLGESGGSVAFSWTKVATNQSYAQGVTFYEVITTVTLTDPTAGETVADTTPDLTFNGTSTDKATTNNIEYQLQVGSNLSLLDIHTNLVRSYKLDENTGTNVADSINSQDGTWQGTLGSQWTTGIINSGGLFNGSDNRISLPYQNIGTTISYSVWFNTTSSASANQALLSFMSTILAINVGAGTWAWWTWDGGANVTPTQAFSTTEWHHAVVTQTGTTYVLYLDGSQSATGATAQGVNTGVSVGSFIGAYNATSYPFTGEIDEVCIWNRVLSSTEVSSLYNAGVGHQLPLADFISSLSTDALGDFEAGHPWDDAEVVTYTCSTLAAGTYYWRVRGKDTTYGVWGAWSTGAGSGYESFVLSVTSAALTGTVTDDTEANIVTGGSTIILTLTGDTFLTFDDTIRQAIINGLDSGGSEANGWDAVVKATQSVGGVVRTSATVCTITLDAFATYDITATETITATIPASALTGAAQIVASPTFNVTATGGVVAATGFMTTNTNFWGT